LTFRRQRGSTFLRHVRLRPGLSFAFIGRSAALWVFVPGAEKCAWPENLPAPLRFIGCRSLLSIVSRQGVFILSSCRLRSGLSFTFIGRFAALWVFVPGAEKMRLARKPTRSAARLAIGRRQSKGLSLRFLPRQDSGVSSGPVAVGKKAKLSKTRTRQDPKVHYNPVAADYSSAASASNSGLFDAELATDAKDGRGGDAVELAEFVDGGVVLFGDFGEGVAFLDGVIDFFGLLGLNRLGGLNGIA
jgi:hypothetical protein